MFRKRKEPKAKKSIAEALLRDCLEAEGARRVCRRGPRRAICVG